MIPLRVASPTSFRRRILENERSPETTSPRAPRPLAGPDLRHVPACAGIFSASRSCLRAIRPDLTCWHAHRAGWSLLHRHLRPSGLLNERDRGATTPVTSRSTPGSDGCQAGARLDDAAVLQETNVTPSSRRVPRCTASGLLRVPPSTDRATTSSLDRCWEAHEADQMPYIEALADLLGGTLVS